MEKAVANCIDVEHSRINMTFAGLKAALDSKRWHSSQINWYTGKLMILSKNIETNKLRG